RRSPSRRRRRDRHGHAIGMAAGPTADLLAERRQLSGQTPSRDVGLRKGVAAQFCLTHLCIGSTRTLGHATCRGYGCIALREMLSAYPHVGRALERQDDAGGKNYLIDEHKLVEVEQKTASIWQPMFLRVSGK